MFCSIFIMLVGFPSSTFPSNGAWNTFRDCCKFINNVKHLVYYMIGNHIYIWQPRVMNWGWLSIIKSQGNWNKLSNIISMWTPSSNCTSHGGNLTCHGALVVHASPCGVVESPLTLPLQCELNKHIVNL